MLRATDDEVRWGGARTTLSSLAVRNYRYYFIGQAISMAGQWMQGVGQAWLVLRLTGSGTALGVVVSLQFLPLLLFGPWGGLIADRLNKHRTIVLTQILAGLVTLALAITVVNGSVRLWTVYAAATAIGLLNVVDMPCRQAFVAEMVGRDQLTNAVSLNAVMVNLARVVGPAVAAVLIATAGLSACFMVNAASYLAVIGALLLMRRSELVPVPSPPRAKGQLQEGLRYVRATPEVLVPLLMMAVIGTLAFEFQVAYPLMARYVYAGDAGTYGSMSTAIGLGAVVGGLFVASRTRHPPTSLCYAALAFGVVMLGTALAPTLALELVALVLMGAASIIFMALANSAVQLASSPAMRGRVMALWSVAFVGSTPVGGPIVGWIGQHLGPRYGVGIGGIASLAAGAGSYRVLRRIERRRLLVDRLAGASTSS